MIRVFLLLLPLTTFADTTGNLLPQQFFNNNQGHGGWNCNDPSHNHGNSIVAGVHGDFIENTITLGDTLNQSQVTQHIQIVIHRVSTVRVIIQLKLGLILLSHLSLLLIEQ